MFDEQVSTYFWSCILIHHTLWFNLWPYYQLYYNFIQLNVSMCYSVPCLPATDLRWTLMPFGWLWTFSTIPAPTPHPDLQPVELSGMGLKKTEYTDNILKLLGGFWVTSGHTASSNRDPVICTNKQFPSHPPDCPQAEEGTLHWRQPQDSTACPSLPQPLFRDCILQTSSYSLTVTLKHKC
jgi:hypothetical protein